MGFVFGKQQAKTRALSSPTTIPPQLVSDASFRAAASIVAFPTPQQRIRRAGSAHSAVGWLNEPWRAACAMLVHNTPWPQDAMIVAMNSCIALLIVLLGAFDRPSANPIHRGRPQPRRLYSRRERSCAVRVCPFYPRVHTFRHTAGLLGSDARHIAVSGGQGQFNARP